MSKKESSIIIRKRHFAALSDYLFRTQEVESAAMAFYNYSESNMHVKLLIKALILPKDEDYLTRSPGRVSLRSEFAEYCHQLCEQNKWNLLDIHTHPKSESVAFSPIDDAEMTNTKAPYLEKYVPNVNIAFMVFGKNTNIIAARYWELKQKKSVEIGHIVIL